MSHKTLPKPRLGSGDIQCACGRIFNVDGIGFCRYCVDKM